MWLHTSSLLPLFLFLAINVSILLIFAVELFLYFQINPFVYFTGDFEKIVSDPNAVNRTIFIANMQGILLAAVVAISVSFFIEKLMDNKVLTIRAAENVVRILPPLNVKKTELDLALKIIKKVCSKY